jgi:hypothetical protein
MGRTRLDELDSNVSLSSFTSFYWRTAILTHWRSYAQAINGEICRPPFPSPISGLHAFAYFSDPDSESRNLFNTKPPLLIWEYYQARLVFMLFSEVNTDELVSASYAVG